MSNATDAPCRAPTDTGKRLDVRVDSTVPRTDSAVPVEFENWFREHRATVFRYVRFRVETREAAEDVTSDVFFKAMRAFARYDPTRAAPLTWLLGIARNAVADHLRALRRRSALYVSVDRVPDMVSGVASAEERLLREERIQSLLNGVRLLGSTDQDILSLRYGSGLRNREIAEHLGISTNAVAVRHHRALKKLHEVVHRNLDAEHPQR